MNLSGTRLKWDYTILRTICLIITKVHERGTPWRPRGVGAPLPIRRCIRREEAALASAAPSVVDGFSYSSSSKFTTAPVPEPDF